MSIPIPQAAGRFAEHFGTAPELGARAPGRVNIIGEHTDYNHGFVLPMAIERETLLLAVPRGDTEIHAFAANLDATARAGLEKPQRHPGAPWLDYILGVAHELHKLGLPVRGADVLILGDVPLACGLSSSASLEMAALSLFEALGGFTLEGPGAASLGQRVENDFLGLSSGIMDQFISRLGKRDHAIHLDCRGLAYTQVPAALPSAQFVIANTNVARGLTASKYNERVAECAQAVAGMNAALDKSGTHLRDFTLDELRACRKPLDDTVYRRARHVISENLRTGRAAAALQSADLEELGRLMNASDESLVQDYAVSSRELMAMTEIARTLNGCHGSRMTGAGFGGCTISLVDREEVEAFSRQLLELYARRCGLQGEVIFSSPAEGAGSFDL